MFKDLAQLPESVEILKACGLDGNDDFLKKIEQFYNDLVEVNKTMNLTRITTVDEFWIKHILDSLLIIKVLPALAEGTAYHVADIGSGGGIPLLPLAIAFPKSRFVGFESRRKKAFYLLDEIEKLGLENCAVFPQRAIEASVKDEFRGEFDVVTARAVARLEKLIPESRKFLHNGGEMVFYKTPQQLDEEKPSASKSAHQQRVKLYFSETFTLPIEFGDRQFAMLSPLTKRK